MAKEARGTLKLTVKTEGREKFSALQKDIDAFNKKADSFKGHVKDIDQANKEWSKSTKQISKDLKEAERNQRDYTGALSGFIGMAAKVAAGFAAIVAGIAALVVKSEKFKQVENAFKNLTASQGQDADTLLAKMTEMTDGMVSKYDLMINANKAAMLGLPIERLGEMMKIAQSAAASTGESMEFMLQSIVLGLGRQSRLILDNLGIVVDVDNAYREYAATLGKTAGQLTEAEKKQAFLNKALEIGMRNAKDAGEASDNQAKAFERLKAKASNLVVLYGSKFVPIIEKVFRGLSKLLDVMEDIGKSKILDSAISKTIKAFHLLSGMAYGVTSRFQQLVAIITLDFDKLARISAEREQHLKNFIEEKKQLDEDEKRRQIENALDTRREIAKDDLWAAQQIMIERQKVEANENEKREKARKLREATALEDAIASAETTGEAVGRTGEKARQEAAKKEAQRWKNEHGPQPTTGDPLSLPPMGGLPAEGPALPPGGVATGSPADIAEADLRKRVEAVSDYTQAFVSKGLQGVTSKVVSTVADAYLPGIGGAVGAIFDLLSMETDEFEKRFNEMLSVGFLENIPENIKTMFDKLSEPEYIGALTEAFTEAFMTIAPEAIAAFANIISEPGWIAAFVENVADGYYSGIRDGVKRSAKELSRIKVKINLDQEGYNKFLADVKQGFQDAPAKLGEGLENALPSLMQRLDDFWHETMSEMGNAGAAAVDRLASYFTGNLGPKIDELTAKLGQAGQDFINGFADVGRMFEEMFKGVKLPLPDMSEISGKITNMFSKGAFDGLWQAIGDIGERIANVFGDNIFKGLSKALDDLGERIKELFTIKLPEVPGGGSDNPGGVLNPQNWKLNKGGLIPVQHFAAGGGVDTVPARLTPGEFVVNAPATSRNMALLETINSGGSAGGGTVIHLNVYGGLLGNDEDARKLAVAIDRHMMELRRQNGSLAFDTSIV